MGGVSDVLKSDSTLTKRSFRGAAGNRPGVPAQPEVGGMAVPFLPAGSVAAGQKKRLPNLGGVVVFELVIGRLPDRLESERLAHQVFDDLTAIGHFYSANF